MEETILQYKKIMILTILLVSLLAVSAVSAADNVTSNIASAYEATDEVVGVDNDNQVIDSFDGRNNILSANPDGTFTDLANEIANATGELKLTKNYVYDSSKDSKYSSGIEIKKELTINGKAFVINGNNQARAFKITVSDVVLNNICFVNCSVSSSSSNHDIYSYGGAIYWSGIKGVLNNCSFVNCSSISNSMCNSDMGSTSSYGGAVYWYGGDGVLANCSFMNCSASSSSIFGRDDAFGGAVSWSGVNGVLANCSFMNCSTSSSFSYVGEYAFCYAYSYGGAVFGGSAVNCTFINNFAKGGGAIADCSAVNCTFIGNGAYESGAMYGDAVNCTFINNGAYYGGAMEGGSAVNCTFINNIAAEYGGAMFGGYAVNCIFINNTAHYYGGAMEGGSAVNCIFVNNNVREVDTEKCTFTIYKKSVISATNLTTVYGVSKNLVATLKDVGRNLLFGKEISIVLNNKEYALTTDSKGQVSLSIPTNLAPGTYVATITYAGNYEYDSSTTTADVVVQKADTSISAVYNNTANEIVATLTNPNTGKVISSANVKFNINGKTTTVKTNSKGQAKISTADLPTGSTVTISYDGNSKYNSASTKVDLVTKIDMSISAVYKDGQIVATLTNGATGNAVSGANVKVSFNGETTTLKTNTKGQVKLSAAGLPLGTYPATFSYAGNSKYNAASTSINVEVKTKVIVTDVYAYSDRIVAKLTNGATGKTIANANMIVEINGVKYNAKSDNKGQLTFDTTGLDLPSAYDLTISYRGNDRYTASSATVAVDLNKANMMITTNYHADKQKMVATLKNSKTGKVVSNANMIIDLNGVKTTYKSNDQGKITLLTNDFAPGTYVGTVTYPGNARYNSISAVFKVDV